MRKVNLVQPYRYLVIENKISVKQQSEASIHYVWVDLVLHHQHHIIKQRILQRKLLQVIERVILFRREFVVFGVLKDEEVGAESRFEIKYFCMTPYSFAFFRRGVWDSTTLVRTNEWLLVGIPEMRFIQFLK